MTQQHTCHRLVCHLSQTLHFYCPQSCIAQQSDFSLPLVSNVALPPICNPVSPNCHKSVALCSTVRGSMLNGLGAGATCLKVVSPLLPMPPIRNPTMPNCYRERVALWSTVRGSVVLLQGWSWSDSNVGCTPTPTLI